MGRIFYQGQEPWGSMFLRPGPRERLRMAGFGCAATTAVHLFNALRGETQTPAEMLPVLRAATDPLALVDGAGGPGELIYWPGTCAAMGLVCEEAIASAPDHEDALHELGGHLVDPNADLAGALAAAMVGGLAAVRVDVDGDGLGDHTITCLRREGAMFVCACSALAAEVTLDENLEAPGVRWNGRPHPYRAVGIRAVRLPG